MSLVRTLLLLVPVLLAGCADATEDEETVSDESELTTAKRPRGSFRRSNEIPYMGMRGFPIGLGEVTLNANGTFERDVLTDACASVPCAPIHTKGRYRLTRSADQQYLSFFDAQGKLLDRWHSKYEASGLLLLTFADEGTSGLTFVTGGYGLRFWRTWPDVALGPSDDGKTVTLQIGQQIVADLPVGSGEWWRVREADWAFGHRPIDLFWSPPGDPNPLPEGKRRLIWTAAAYSLGTHPVVVEKVRQDGTVDRADDLHFTAKVVHGEATDIESCAGKECVWVGPADEGKTMRVRAGQPVVVQLRKTFFDWELCGGDLYPSTAGGHTAYGRRGDPVVTDRLIWRTATEASATFALGQHHLVLGKRSWAPAGPGFCDVSFPSFYFTLEVVP